MSENRSTAVIIAKSNILLEEAVEEFRAALDVYSSVLLPQQWARTQDNLGRALESLGDRSTWSEVRAFWQSAEQAYLEALKMRTIEETPYNHNATKANLERVQFKLNL